MSKTLCKQKKTIKSDIKLYMAQVNKPTHVCTKCGRAANNRKQLCSPAKMVV